MLPPGRLLVIADGGLPGLLACAAAGDRSSATPAGPHAAWAAPAHDATAPFRREAIERQADLYGLTLLATPSAAAEWQAVQGSHDNRTLLDAAAAAVSSGADAVVWPVTAGPSLDLERTSRALDRTLLVERLSGLDGAPVRVTAPYADLTDRQIADLVIDMDLPVWTCWWWDLASADCGRGGSDVPPVPAPVIEAAIAELARWAPSLRAAGWSPRPSPPGSVPSAHPARPGSQPAAAHR